MIANAIQSQPETPMRHMLQKLEKGVRLACAPLICAMLLSFASQAQQQPQTPSQPPASQPPASQSQSSQSGDQKPPAQSPADQKTADQKQNAASPSSSASGDTSTYDPFHAQQDVEVGNYYLHRGDVDAAIARYEDAIRLRDNFAEPRRLLAECYEKKHNTAKALKYYREYLKVFPDAPDRKKIEKKIEKLSE